MPDKRGTDNRGSTVTVTQLVLQSNLPTTVNFMTKQKSLRKIFEWIVIYC